MKVCTSQAADQQLPMYVYICWDDVTQTIIMENESFQFSDWFSN